MAFIDGSARNRTLVDRWPMITATPVAELGLPTPADEIPGDFFESLKIPGDFRFLLYKRAPKKKFLFLVLIFRSFP